MKSKLQWLGLIFTSILLMSCSSVTPLNPANQTPSKATKKSFARDRGAYYQNDGPADHIPVDLDLIPNAVPQSEPLIKSANMPYSVMGMSFRPNSSNAPYRAKGIASWYGKQFHGRRTASGERYNMFAMTAAHPTLPIPSYARVTNLKNGRSVVVRITDRGPFHAGRLADLSYAAAHRLRFISQGSASVLIERVWPSSEQPIISTTTASALKKDDRPKYLQLGAFHKLANAETRLKKLVDELGQNYDAKLAIVNYQGVYRVRLGPFPSDAAVRKAAETLNVENIVMGDTTQYID